MPLDAEYDPFAPGPFRVAERTVSSTDPSRARSFPIEVWSPAGDGPDVEHRPLILFSHSGGGDRRQSSFCCAHLASHGYVVAGLDHSERVVPELATPAEESDEERTRRWDAVIAGRVPDMGHLLETMLVSGGMALDPARIGALGHSFGGWTVLATVEVEPRVSSVVAWAPGGASKRKPGILPLELSFDEGRDVPTLYLVAEGDTSLPLEGMFELYERNPATEKRMFALRRADHMHFMDDVERLHEAVRTMPMTGAWEEIQKEMLPAAELVSEATAHAFVRGLTLCHFDASLRGSSEARRVLDGGAEQELEARGIDARRCEADS